MKINKAVIKSLGVQTYAPVKKHEPILQELVCKKTLRQWQLKALEHLKDLHTGILNAPTGAGKSLVLSFIAVLKALEGMKILIIVPQKTIALSWLSNTERRFEVGKKKFLWSPQNLCDNRDETVCNNLIDFLKNKQDGSSKEIAICTDAAFSLLMSKLKGKQYHYFKNVFIIKDEAHHMRSDEFQNTLSRGIEKALEHDAGCIQATATMYRGDHGDIINDKMRENYFPEESKFIYSFEDYVTSTDCHIENFNFKIVMYNGAYINALKKIKKEDKPKHSILYLPRDGSPDRIGTKEEDIAEIFKVFPNHLDLLDYNGNNQKENIEKIEKNKEFKTPLVITQSLMQEGSNWLPAENIIVVGRRESITQLVQMIGRLFRNYKDKKSVTVYFLVPYSFNSSNEQKVREDFNAFLNSIVKAQILQEIVNPVPLPMYRKRDRTNEPRRKLTIIQELFTEQSKQLQFREDIIKTVLCRVTDEMSKTEKRYELMKVVREKLDEYNKDVTDDQAERVMLQIYVGMDRVNTPKFSNIHELNAWILDDEASDPFNLYVSENIGLGTFEKIRNALGRIEWASFEKAREYASSLNLNSKTEWSEHCKSGDKPNNIPSNSYNTYKDKGWNGWGDFLGTGNVRGVFLPFEKAREYARFLNLNNQKEWYEHCKSRDKPNDIPNCPERAYKDKGWINWADFLGTNNIKSGFLSFEKAREYAYTLNLNSRKEWVEHCRSGNKLKDIPNVPDSVYKDKGWINWADFLGTNNIKSGFLLFEKAREYARSLNLNSKKEWDKYCKSGNKPNDIPNGPYGVYKDKGWVNWADFLGTNNIKGGFLSFKEARKYARSLNLNNQTEWRVHCKSGDKSNDIPNYPESAYKDKGWNGWDNFLGTGNIKDGFLPFDEARKYARSLNLNSKKEWDKYCKSGNKSKDIPNCPESVYKYKGWNGWADFLNTNNIIGGFRPFEKARDYACSLNLNSRKEWYEHCKSGDKLNDIPNDPYSAYKNKGWISWANFLGTDNVRGSKRK